MCKCRVKILVITESNGECITLGNFLCASCAFTHLDPFHSKTSLGSTLALAGALGATGLHLLLGEAAQITTGGGVTTLREALLAAESELRILLLALRVAALTVTAALAAIGLVSLLDSDVEEVIGIVGGGGSVSLALCGTLLAFGAKI